MITFGPGENTVIRITEKVRLAGSTSKKTFSIEQSLHHAFMDIVSKIEKQQLLENSNFKIANIEVQVHLHEEE